MHDAIIQMDEDNAWRRDGERHGWTLPPKAAWPLRLPIIRAFRAAWLDYRVHKAASDWASAGIGVGGPNQRDLWILYAIARGWC
ncbi:hypothetical protein SB2_11985 [Methylobacterium radiotolerans]|nr:hypothetical protein SB3_11180 [Methylobacterium radiotolerans]KTS48010.1 hypothetical protein SB2_11985 [Methylobacterium radiotolerans]